MKQSRTNDEDELENKGIERKKGITMDASHEAKLGEVFYDYGGVEAIRLSRSNTPQHILHTFKEWCDLR